MYDEVAGRTIPVSWQKGSTVIHDLPTTIIMPPTVRKRGINLASFFQGSGDQWRRQAEQVYRRYEKSTDTDLPWRVYK